jgi:ribosomal protein S18 acetylase RimI-like enzyme
MTADDLDFAAEQTAREGWASGRSDFELYLDHDPDGCFVAGEGGRRVGMVTTTRYPSSGWIGNLIVVPECRSRGVGRALMEHGLAHLEAAGVETVRLDGDPPGIPLYLSLGFVDEWESLRYRWAGSAIDVAEDVEKLGSEDLDRVAELDRRYFGDDRARLLGLFLEKSHSAYKVENDHGLRGYLMATRSDLGLRIGPCVAADVETARLLVSAVLADAGAEQVTVGVPGPNQQAAPLLETLGFEPTPPCRRMIRGPVRAEDLTGGIFAIANGAVG